MGGKKPDMINRLTSRRDIRFLSFLCCLVYFVSYLTRLNYAACLAEVQRSLNISKSLAGLPVTGCFITYGIGQLLCGFMGDRFHPPGYDFYRTDGHLCL